MSLSQPSAVSLSQPSAVSLSQPSAVCRAGHFDQSLSQDHHMYPRNRAKGFTLIELLIVVAIIGILSAIAVPKYQDYVLKGRRAAAQAFLLQAAQRQQQYFLDNRAYAPSFSTLGLNMTSDVSPYYELVDIITGAAPPTFSIEVKPIGSQARNNEPNLKIDSAGNRTPSGSSYGAW
jgi:type IV pilus assembly protein PilE